MIKQVQLSLKADLLVVNVELEAELSSESMQYAYYVYRAEQRIHVQWYSAQPSFEFDTKGCTGVYCVQAFVKNAAEEICAKISAKVDLQNSEADLPDYSRWQLPVHHGRTDDLSILANADDAIYRLSNAENQVLEVMITGLSRAAISAQDESAVLVSFHGAVANRQNYRAPFFSGAGVAKRCNMPLISFADPVITADKNLSLGWYAGSEAYPMLQHDIARILDWISAQFGVRYICFGGSGGGFAILNVLSKIKASAQAFIWNPQTSISEYSPAMVERYVKSAFPTAFMSQYRPGIRLNNTFFYSVFSSIGIEHDLTQISLASNKRVFYIQNSSDTHVLNHAGPFMQDPDWIRHAQRIFSSESKQTTMWIGLWGEGHAAPEANVVYDVMLRMIANQPLHQIATHLDTHYNSQLNAVSAYKIDNFTPEIALASCIQGHRVASVVLTNGEGFGITYAFQLTDANSHKKVDWYTADACNVMDIPSEFSGELKMTVYVRDALGAKFTKTISLTSV